MFKKGFVAAGSGIVGSLLFLSQALAQGESVMSAGHNEYTVKAVLGLAVCFGLAIAVFGGALGQSKAAAAALDGIGRNPGAQNKVFTPMLLGLALIESLVIYAFVISLLLLGKI